MLQAQSPHFLLVKLSSLGDVLHNLPIVWDIRNRYQNATVDWVVEEAYVDLLKPLQSSNTFKGIDRVIPIGLRRWKKNILSLRHWQELKQFIHALQQDQYDVIIDSQGLMKSAVVAKLTHRTQAGKITGLANATEFSGYEPLAGMFYSDSVTVPRKCHAVDRSRYLLSSALDIAPITRSSIPKFYPESFVKDLANQNLSPEIAKHLKTPYVLCFHATARAAKQWDIQGWITVGKFLLERGLHPVFPWGSTHEKQISQQIIEGIGGGDFGGVVPPPYSIKQYFEITSHARLTIGVDTGLTHLAAVLGHPTIEIYCDSPLWKTEGYWSNQVINLGDIGQPPSINTVLNGIEHLISS
jgi:heptosyltransferase I